VLMALAVHDATVPADADGACLVGEEASEDARDVSAVPTTVITLLYNDRWVQDFNSGADAEMIERLCDKRSLCETCVSASSYLLQRVTS
jgi:hypothetical protein